MPKNADMRRGTLISLVELVSCESQMMPIQELLNRIRWDRDFARASFELGYADHLERKILRIPFEEVRFEEGNHFSFQMVDVRGEIVTIPFHRIRHVYRDGVLIWQRGPAVGE